MYVDAYRDPGVTDASRLLGAETPLAIVEPFIYTGPVTTSARALQTIADLQTGKITTADVTRPPPKPEEAARPFFAPPAPPAPKLSDTAQIVIGVAGTATAAGLAYILLRKRAPRRKGSRR